jgi:hypothetical protein
MTGILTATVTIFQWSSGPYRCMVERTDERLAREIERDKERGAVRSFDCRNRTEPHFFNRAHSPPSHRAQLFSIVSFTSAVKSCWYILTYPLWCYILTYSTYALHLVHKKKNCNDAISFYKGELAA